MIGRLRGNIIDKHPPTILLEAGGVGYEVDVPLSALEALPGIGDEAVLHTHLSIREDGQTLFGFLERSERDLFRVLIRVSGVGPRLALALLSGLNGAELRRCVHEEDTTTMTRIPGVGRKTAQRLIVELRDRLEGLLPAAPSGTAGAVHTAAGAPLNEAIEALTALGYKPQEAARMARAVGGEGLASETIIRRALQQAIPQRPPANG